MLYGINLTIHQRGQKKEVLNNKRHCLKTFVINWFLQNDCGYSPTSPKKTSLRSEDHTLHLLHLLKAIQDLLQIFESCRFPCSRCHLGDAQSSGIGLFDLGRRPA